MKDWSYYQPKSVFPDRFEYRKQLVREINDAKMTTSEREEAMRLVPFKTAEWMKEAIRPFDEERTRLEKEFWADCRDEFGYDKWLGVEGISVIESAAYNRGYSGGLREVHNCLYDIVGLAEKIAECLKEKR